jgi:hypothetical protein
MEISRPNARELTPEELQDLEKLKVTIEKATADGKLTQYELDRIKAIAWSDNKILSEELELVRTLIREKIERGELEIDYWP